MVIDDISTKIQLVIGRLLKDADAASKKVLTAFDPSKDSAINIAKLKNLPRQELDTLGTYLGLKLLNESGKKIYSTRDKVAKRIVLEIRSLYPSVCSECEEEYTVMQGDQPRRRCWICLQGLHDCAAMTAKVEIISKLEVQLNSFVWLCSDCLTLNNPFPSEQETQSGTADPKTPKEKDKENVASASGGSELKKDLSKEKLDTAQAEQVPTEQVQAESESKSKPNTCKLVCPRLIQNSCPHGISGTVSVDGKEKCELFHPPRCRKYMHSYTHETKGCTKGDDCSRIHVKICKSSVETKKCADIDCIAMHLFGTKRPRSMRKKKTHDDKEKDVRKVKEVKKKTPDVKARTKEKSENQPKKRVAGKDPQDRKKTAKPKGDSFLEMKSLLDEVKKNFLGEIRSLREEMKMYKRPLYNSEQQHCGHFRPTPCEAAEYHLPCQQRRKTCSSLSQPGTIPTPHVCC